MAEIFLGETTILAGSDVPSSGLIKAVLYTLAERGTVQSMTFYVQSGTANLEMGVYDDDGAGGDPGTLLCNTAGGAPGTVPGWNTQAIVTPVVLEPGTYYVAFNTDAAITLRAESTGGVNKRDIHPYGGLSNPFVFSSENTFRYSMYATLESGSAQLMAQACL